MRAIGGRRCGWPAASNHERRDGRLSFLPSVAGRTDPRRFAAVSGSGDRLPSDVVAAWGGRARQLSGMIRSRGNRSEHRHILGHGDPVFSDEATAWGGRARQSSGLNRSRGTRLEHGNILGHGDPLSTGRVFGPRDAVDRRGEIFIQSKDRLRPADAMVRPSDEAIWGGGPPRKKTYAEVLLSGKKTQSFFKDIPIRSRPV